MTRPRILSIAAALFVALAVCSTTAARAQQPSPGMNRVVLEKHDLAVPGREGVLVRVELAPGVEEPKHTHPGDTFAYVLEGTFSLWRDGQPTSHFNPGEAFYIPAGQVHSVKNDGAAPVKLAVTFFVEKGKPITTPVK
jgi:quercetin dioxygenase-like cupin family protein